MVETTSPLAFLYAYLGNWLLLTGLLAPLYHVIRLRPMLRFGLLLLPLLLLLIPLSTITLNGYLFSLIGHLSITSLLLLAVSISKCCIGITLMKDSERHTLLIILALISIIYYPLALGLTPFDPYRLGYPGGVFAYILCGAALISWYFEQRALALMLALALMAPLYPLGESANMLDYILDVWISLYAIFYTLGMAVKNLWVKSRLIDGGRHGFRH